MKFIAVIFLLFSLNQAYSYSCPGDMTDVTDRRRCFSNMLSHWIEDAQKELIAHYKDALQTSQAYATRSQIRATNNTKEILEWIILYNRSLDTIKNEALDVYIKNRVAIPTTCSAASSGSSS